MKRSFRLLLPLPDGLNKQVLTGFNSIWLTVTSSPHSFLQGSIKERTGGGGSHKNRFHIVRRILDGIRDQLGDFPVLAKINGHEKGPGLKIEDAVIFSKMLEEARCDALEISCGIGEDHFYTIRGNFPVEMLLKVKNIKLPAPVVKGLSRLANRKKPEPSSLYNLSAAELIRKEVSLPVIVVGGIRSLSEAEAIISSEESDYIALSRSLILEPSLVNRWKREGGASKCIDCNHCLIGALNGPTKCYYGRV